MEIIRSLLEMFNTANSRVSGTALMKKASCTTRNKTRTPLLVCLRVILLVIDLILSRFMVANIVALGLLKVYYTLSGHTLSQILLSSSGLSLSEVNHLFNQGLLLECDNLLKLMLLLAMTVLVHLTIWKGTMGTIVTPWGMISLSKKKNDDLIDLDKVLEKMEYVCMVDRLIKEVMDEVMDSGNLYDVIDAVIKVYTSNKIIKIRQHQVVTDLSFKVYSTCYIPINHSGMTWYVVFQANAPLDELDLFIMRELIFETWVAFEGDR